MPHFFVAYFRGGKGKASSTRNTWLVRWAISKLTSFCGFKIVGVRMDVMASFVVSLFLSISLPAGESMSVYHFETEKARSISLWVLNSGWQASFLEPMMKEYVDAAKFCGQNGWRKELGHDKQNLSQVPLTLLQYACLS